MAIVEANFPTIQLARLYIDPSVTPMPASEARNRYRRTLVGGDENAELWNKVANIFGVLTVEGSVAEVLELMPCVTDSGCEALFNAIANSSFAAIQLRCGGKPSGRTPVHLFISLTLECEARGLQKSKPPTGWGGTGFVTAVPPTQPRSIAHLVPDRLWQLVSNEHNRITLVERVEALNITSTSGGHGQWQLAAFDPHLSDSYVAEPQPLPPLMSPSPTESAFWPVPVVPGGSWSGIEAGTSSQQQQSYHSSPSPRPSTSQTYPAASSIAAHVDPKSPYSHHEVVWAMLMPLVDLRHVVVSIAERAAIISAAYEAMGEARHHPDFDARSTWDLGVILPAMLAVKVADIRYQPTIERLLAQHEATNHEREAPAGSLA